MSPLEAMMNEQQKLVNKGNQIDQIQCAALMLIASNLGDIKAELERVNENLMNIEVNTRGNN
jgi:hypothetical protein